MEARINNHKIVRMKQDLNDIPALQKRAVIWPISYYQIKYKSKNQAITQALLSGSHSLKEFGDNYEKHYTIISRIIK